MPNESGNKVTNNNENKFPKQGNFSAYQNNMGSSSVGKLGAVKDIATNSINGVKNSNQNSDNPTNLKDNIKKETAKKGVEMAANAVGGPLAGQAAKAIMDSKLGNKVLNSESKKSINPIGNPLMGLGVGKGIGKMFSKKEDSKSNENESETEDVQSKSSQSVQSIVPKEVKKKLIPAVAIGGVGCLGSIFMIAIIASTILSPVMYINKIINGIASFWDNVVLFFKGCKSETECVQKDENKFYDTLTDIHEKYKSEPYYITLNTELITATLTYMDPMEALENLSDNGSTTTINYKKSKKKVEELAEKMVGKGEQCVDEENGTVIIKIDENGTVVFKNHSSISSEYKECPDTIEYYVGDEKNKTKIEIDVTGEDWYYLDEEKYRNYLLYGDDSNHNVSFIKDFYKVKQDKVENIVDEIYLRAETAKYLNSSENTSTNVVANNLQVVIMDCTGMMELETVSLYEYLQGVLYMEENVTESSEEFLKAQAIIAKNYLYSINGATPDSIPTTLRIKNCQTNQKQLYCSVENGCYSMEDNTIASGSATNGIYYKEPINDVVTLQKIKSAIDSTLNEFIIKDNKFVVTQYDNSVNEMIKGGSTYIEVLSEVYDGTIEEIISNIVYPLDLVNNNVTSAFGWRVHPIHKYCRTHNGTDIAAPANANIYSIADGVVVNNYYHSSYGNVTIIGHGSYVDGYYEYYSLYAHQIRLSTHINVGQEVKVGQVIGNVGSTGDSTGNHLHIEIYTMKNGVKVRQDPVEYFKGVELTGKVGGTLYGSEAQCNACLNTYGAGNC